MYVCFKFATVLLIKLVLKNVLYTTVARYGMIMSKIRRLVGMENKANFTLRHIHSLVNIRSKLELG